MKLKFIPLLLLLPVLMLVLVACGRDAQTADTPTELPIATPTPYSTLTPVLPTATPYPTYAPVIPTPTTHPTFTPIPTATPVPTATPARAPTPTTTPALRHSPDEYNTGDYTHS